MANSSDAPCSPSPTLDRGRGPSTVTTHIRRAELGRQAHPTPVDKAPSCPRICTAEAAWHVERKVWSMPELISMSRNRSVQTDNEGTVIALMCRAREAIQAYSNEINKLGQARIDEAVTALAWSIYKPENARRLAELAVEVTGIGEVESKVTKNQRKTFGTLRDLLRVKSTGIIEEIPEKGLVKYAKPVGVVAAVTPSTNPSATPVNKAMMALKGGNAIVIAPPP